MIAQPSPPRPPIQKADWIEGMARGMAVLESFDTERQRLNATLTAQRTGLTRAAARRHLLTLTHLGYLETDGQYYWLSAKVLGFAGSYLSGARLPRAVQPTLHQLSLATQLSCSVAVLQNDAVIIVARGIWQGSELPAKASHTVLAYGLHVGTRLPAHATSTGQVLLANLAPTQLQDWLKANSLSRLTANTSTQTQALKQKLKQVAKQDYCVADQEHELGVDALAVPLRNARGNTVAALNLVRSGVGSTSVDLAARWLPLLQHTAQSLRTLI
ncbi:IclR family transcriptional regulator C-terminal domain-containing protein [Limnohabitans sp.]|uniref:IclR family transcriptional regulator domain-containing protein n=1 Tax=Limnohabitans sp. TaxID=1907725 RepID=UPI0038B92A78